MLMHYAPRYLFRQIPKALLQEYFTGRNLLSTFDWAAHEEQDVEPLHDEWLKIDAKERAVIEGQFRRVVDLATPAGVRVILEESGNRHHNVDLKPELDALNSLYQKAFWTMVKQPTIFHVASLIQHAEQLNGRCWNRRVDMPKQKPDDSVAACTALAEELKKYFWKSQGRGDVCTVERYMRGDHEYYFFAYPSDYADTSIEYTDDGQFARRPHKPAFEVVYVFNDEDGVLELFARGDKKVKLALQQCFGRAILQTHLGPESARKPPYELNPLKTRGFHFETPAADFVKEVRVLMLRLSHVDSHGRMVFEGDPEKGPDAVYEFMEKALAVDRLPLTKFNVTKATIRVVFAPPGQDEHAVTFNLGYPSSCSLRDEPDHAKIKGYLKDPWKLANV